MSEHGRIPIGYSAPEWVSASNAPFSSSIWKREVDIDRRDNARGGMIHSLLSEYLWEGMSDAEIREVLGPPDLERKEGRSRWLLWGLGLHSGFKIDIDYLELRFDSTSGLRTAVVQQH